MLTWLLSSRALVEVEKTPVFRLVELGGPSSGGGTCKALCGIFTPTRRAVWGAML